jgi:hypothetical protein
MLASAPKRWPLDHIFRNGFPVLRETAVFSPFMKVTIEFELPGEQDAHVDAVLGARWKAVVYNLYIWLTMRATTEEHVERQRAFDEVQRFLRDERLTAGLTFCCSENLRELNAKHHERCTEKLNAYLHEQGFTDGTHPSQAQ